MFRALAEMAPSAIFIIQGTRLRFVNPAAVRLTGYSRQELLKINFYDLFPAGSKKFMRDWGMQVQRGESSSAHGEFNLVKPGHQGRGRTMDRVNRCAHQL